MQIGEYFIVAGTIVNLLLPSQTGKEVGGFLTQVGVALTGGVGSVGPVRVGSEGLTVTIAPYPASPPA